MDRDVLERLATDRALRALPGDVEHLLDAYVKLDPQARAAADEIGRTIDLARGALAEKPPSSMPAFPVAGFQQIERWRRRVQQFTYAAGLAACLSIGLGLGRLTAPAPEVAVAHKLGSPVQANAVTTVVAPDGQSEGATELAQSNSLETTRGFWSVARLKQQREQEHIQPASSSEPTIRIQWPTLNRPT